MGPHIRTYTFPDGTLQRVQTLRLESWQGLNFLSLTGKGGSLDCFADIYRQYLVPSCPWLFGNLVLFTLPEDLVVPFRRDSRYGSLADSLTAAAAGLKQGLAIRHGRPHFKTAEAEAFWNRLKDRDCVRIVSGRLPITQIIPIGPAPGYLSEARPNATLKANASFFIMDPFDCATVFDHVGTCLGLMVKDGIVLNPPLYDREALLVRSDGSVQVESRDIRDLSIQIGPVLYRHGENCKIYTRPRHSRVPGMGTKLVITGRRVAALCRGSVPIPASGFVLVPQGDCSAKAGDSVSYLGMEDVAFGIQVGNSILRDGVKTDAFRSSFYNIRRLEPVPYPPSLYPMDFQNARAARMALGADDNGKPMLLWAEGSPKLGYVPGQHSRGASLSDMADFCADAGMVNVVNLDGGGSAQMLVHGQRHLEISDRRPDGSQSERLIPNGLIME